MKAFFSKNKWIGLSATLCASLTLGLLSGCSTTPPNSMMNVQAGEYFILSQPVTIRAHQSRRYIQSGKLTNKNFSRFNQHCRLEISDLPVKSFTVQPQRFLITRVAIDEERIAANPEAIQLAFNANAAYQTALPALALGEYEREETMDLVHLYLQSSTQPNVLRLTCAGSISDGNPMDGPSSYRPQRQQINRILGAVGSIQK